MAQKNPTVSEGVLHIEARIGTPPLPPQTGSLLRLQVGLRVEGF